MYISNDIYIDSMLKNQYTFKIMNWQTFHVNRQHIMRLPKIEMMLTARTFGSDN